MTFYSIQVLPMLLYTSTCTPPSYHLKRQALDAGHEYCGTGHSVHNNQLHSSPRMSIYECVVGNVRVVPVI